MKMRDTSGWNLWISLPGNLDVTGNIWMRKAGYNYLNVQNIKICCEVTQLFFYSRMKFYYHHSVVLFLQFAVETFLLIVCNLY